MDGEPHRGCRWPVKRSGRAVVPQALSREPERDPAGLTKPYSYAWARQSSCAPGYGLAHGWLAHAASGAAAAYEYE